MGVDFRLSKEKKCLTGKRCFNCVVQDQCESFGLVDKQYSPFYLHDDLSLNNWSHYSVVTLRS